jgi:amidohydrolase
MNCKKLAEKVFEDVRAFRRDFHRHPEPAFEEFRTTAQIAGALDAFGIPCKRLEPTGLTGTISGGKPGKTVLLRADIDALNITEKSRVSFTSENPGFMHACGHDAHAAMLLGAARALQENRKSLCGTVKVLFQPAEEIGLGAKQAIRQGVLEGVDFAFGLHIFAQIPPGTLLVGEGPKAAAADRITIRVHGKTSHGAMPEAGADALLAASAIVLNLQSLVSRESDPTEPLVISIGVMNAGNRFNTIAGKAELEGTIRSFSRELHKQLPGMVERIVKHTAEAYRCTAEVEYTVLTDVLVNDPVAARVLRSAALKAASSPDRVTGMERMMGSEDFSEYTRFVKAGFAALGGGGDYPQHSEYFFIDEDAMKTGIAFYIQTAWECLNGNLTRGNHAQRR